MHRVRLVVGTCTAAALLVSGCAGDATPSPDASVPVSRQAQATPSASTGGLGAVVGKGGSGGAGAVGGNGGAGAGGNGGVGTALGSDALAPLVASTDDN